MSGNTPTWSIANVFTDCWSVLERCDRIGLLWMSLLIASNSVFEVFGISLVIPLIGLVSNPDRIHEMPVLEQFYQWLGVHNDRQFLGIMTAIFVATMVSKNAFYLLSIWLQNKWIYGLTSRVSVRLLKTYLTVPYEVIMNRSSSDLITTVDNIVSTMACTALMAFITIAMETTVMLAISAFLAWSEPLVIAIIVVMMGISALISHALLRHRLTLIGRDIMNNAASRLGFLQQGLASGKELRILGRISTLLAQYTSITDARNRLLSRVAVAGQMPRIIVETILVCSLVLILFVVINQNRSKDEVLGVLGLLAVAAFRFMPSMNRILLAISNIRQSSASTSKLRQEMTTLPSVQPTTDQPTSVFARSLRIQTVHFTYPGAERPALSGIDLEITHGQSIGFVGLSGSGKSTLIDVVLGLLRPQRGAVLLDEEEITGRPWRWRNLAGYVPQTIYLADDTIRRNIAYAVPDKEIDDDRVHEAIALSQLQDLISSLPDGLDTRTGERGVCLSGGQRQRIGIARALYNRPAVLVMDEATAALDGETERSITAALDSLRGIKTMLIIAHRLSTVRHCDRLVLMKEGRIQAIGTFEQLREQVPEFEELVTNSSLK